MKELLRSLRIRNYRIWTIGSVCSNIGTWMQFTAQDWIVLTVITHNDARAVGIVMALQLVPRLLFLPFTGHAADWFNRRVLLMVTQAVMGLLAIGLGILLLTEKAHLWEVWIFAFVFGTVSAFDVPARQTFVAQLVGDDLLSNAVGLNSMSFNLGRMLGPAVGGICIGEIGSGWAFVMNGVSFLTVFGLLQCLRVEEFYPVFDSRSQKKPGIGSGLRYVWQHSDLRVVLFTSFLIGTFGLNFPIFISTMAVQVFHVGAHGYGMLTSITAIGTLMGGMLAAAQARTSSTLLLFGATLFMLGCILAALAPDYAIFAVALVVMGASSLLFTATSSSLMQLTSDPAMRGRVIAIRQAVFAGCTPLGAPLVGWVVNHFGARWGMGVGALAGAVSALVTGLFLWRRRLCI